MPCFKIRAMQEGIPTQSIPDRLEVIANLVRDREVLDLGVVDARTTRGLSLIHISEPTRPY